MTTGTALAEPECGWERLRQFDGRRYRWDDVDRLRFASRDATAERPGRDPDAVADLEPI